MSDLARVPEFDENSRYTYADYLGWEGPERYQLLNGEVFFDGFSFNYTSGASDRIVTTIL